MRRVIVRYKVKPGRAEENEALVRGVFDELARSAPEGLRYASFKEADGLSFVHIAEIEGESNPLNGIPAFKAFAAGIGGRCEVPPAVVELTRVGSYRFAGN
jgi:hypothetical protein